MAALGQICIVGAFGLALYAIVSSVAGVRVRSRELILSGQNAVWAVTAPPKSEIPRTCAVPPPGWVSLHDVPSERPAAVRIEPSAG